MILDIINSIYEKLEDDSSKMIFEKRLEYSISKKQSLIDDMVCHEMKRYGELDILNRCLKWLLNFNVQKISIFGAGFAGSQIAHILRLNGIEIEKVYDNNRSKWNRFCYGVNVSSPDYINGSEYVIIGTNDFRNEILLQIQNAGVENDHIFIPDKSWWLGDQPQYFDNNIMKSKEKEIFIDGGSLDGGDSIEFEKWCNGNYEKIYAFEPDERNVEKIKRNTKGKNIEICPFGMWSEKSVLGFSSGKAEKSSFTRDGDALVDVDSIDNVLGGKPVTFIKMDIEGSELKALEGAAETIRKYKPKLAICVYHKPEDIIEIPKKILELNSNYKLWLRHYSYVDTETVLYAIDEGDLS